MDTLKTIELKPILDKFSKGFEILYQPLFSHCKNTKNNEHNFMQQILFIYFTVYDQPLSNYSLLFNSFPVQLIIIQLICRTIL